MDCKTLWRWLPRNGRKVAGPERFELPAFWLVAEQGQNLNACSSVVYEDRAGLGHMPSRKGMAASNRSSPLSLNCSSVQMASCTPRGSLRVTAQKLRKLAPR